MGGSSPMVLEYAGARTPRDARLPLVLRGVFFLVAVVGAAAPFLPFAIGTAQRGGGGTGIAMLGLWIFWPAQAMGGRVTAGVALGLIAETVTTLVWAARARRG